MPAKIFNSRKVYKRSNAKEPAFVRQKEDDLHFL